MTIQEIANQLANYCTQYKYVEAHDELYAPDAISYEPGEGPQSGTKGVRNIEKKWEQFQQMFEVGTMETNSPVFAGNFFSM